MSSTLEIRLAHERERQDAARRQAVVIGAELVTPAGAAALFGKSEPAVRAAARADRIETAFTVAFSEKEVRLYRLNSCVEYWGAPDSERLEQMRSEAHVTFVANEDRRGGLTYAVLHPEPLVRFEEVAGPAD